jgi:hypothetical protein
MLHVATLASWCTARATSQPEGMPEEYNRIHPDRITGQPGIIFVQSSTEAALVRILQIAL